MPYEVFMVVNTVHCDAYSDLWFIWGLTLALGHRRDDFRIELALGYYGDNTYVAPMLHNPYIDGQAEDAPIQILTLTLTLTLPLIGGRTRPDCAPLSLR